MDRSRRVIVAVAALAVLSLSGCGGSGGSQVVAAGDTNGMDPSMAGMTATSSPGSSSSAMPGMNMAAMNDGDGLSSTLDGYTLTGITAPKKAGKPGAITFKIMGPGGKVQTDFTLQQTVLMHLYIVRKDLTEYQHLHPSIDMKTGVWTVPATFMKPGPYHVLTEFQALKPDGYFDNRKLGGNFTIPGTYKPVPYKPMYSTVSVNGFQLTLDGQPAVGGANLTLKITKDGQDVTDLQPYLESFAHVTGFREGDLKAVHVHPNETPKKDDPTSVGGPTLTLAPLFSLPGKYRLFVQFQTDGKLEMAPLDIDVVA